MNARRYPCLEWEFEPIFPIVRVSENRFLNGGSARRKPLHNTNTEWTHTDIHDMNGIRTHNPIVRLSENITLEGDQPVANTLPNTNTEWPHADIHALNGIRNHNPLFEWAKIFFALGIIPSQIRYLTQTQNERTQTSMPWMGFEHTITLFEWAKIFFCTGDQPVANPLHNTKHRMNARRLPCIQWDSNPQSHCSRERKFFFGRGISPSQIRYITQNTEWTHPDIHALNGIRTHNPIIRVSENISLDGKSARPKSSN
jgi:hypothetical protein